MQPEDGELVAVVFDNFGPYHRARLDAAARLMPLVGIELSGLSSDYAWKPAAQMFSWEHRTLFPGGSCRSVPRRQLARRIASVLDKVRPSVVAVPGWAEPSSLLIAQWCVSRRIPIVVMSASSAHDEVRQPVKEAIKRRLVSLYSAALAAGVMQVSYLRNLGMCEDGIFSGYDAIDNQHFADGATNARENAAMLRLRFGLPERYFLASARFIAKKNLPGLLEAYAAYRACVKENRPDEPWSLVLLGDGILAPAVRAAIQELNLRDSVRLPGFQQYPDLPVFYGLAGAFVLASTTEQWGLVVNEAMASGLPVLVSERCGCAPELVHQGENGYIFDPADKNQLAQLMVKLTSSSCDLDAMGRSSRQIISNFGPENFGAGLLKAVQRAKVVGAPRPSLFTKALLQMLSRVWPGRSNE